MGSSYVFQRTKMDENDSEIRSIGNYMVVFFLCSAPQKLDHPLREFFA